MPSVGDGFPTRESFHERIKAALGALGFGCYIKNSPAYRWNHPKLTLSCSRVLKCKWIVIATRFSLEEKDADGGLAHAEGAHEVVDGRKYRWEVTKIDGSHNHGPSKLEAVTEAVNKRPRLDEPPPTQRRGPPPVPPAAQPDQSGRRRTRSTVPRVVLEAELAEAFPPGEGMTHLTKRNPLQDAVTNEWRARFSRLESTPASPGLSRAHKGSVAR